MNICSPLTPAPPDSTFSTKSSSSSIGIDDQNDKDKSTRQRKEKAKAQKLLTLLRNIDKKSGNITSNERNAYEEGALKILLEFQLNLSHGEGLFGGQSSRAESFLSNTANADNSSVNATNDSKSTGGKQKKRSGTGRGLIDINAVRKAVFLVDSTGSGTSAKTNNLNFSEENLWLACLGRILGVGRSNKILPQGQSSGLSNSNTTDGDDDSKIPLAVVEVAAECITSMCEQTKQTLGNSSLSSQLQFCAKTEFEVLSTFGTQWLNCLANKIQECLLIIDPVATYFGIVPANVKNTNTALNAIFHSPQISLASDTASACLKAAASVVTLLGTRLSRSTHTIAQLHSIAWAALGSGPITPDGQIISNPRIIQSSSILASALPLSGNTGIMFSQGNQNNGSQTTSAPPSTLWTEALSTTICSIALALHASYKYKTISFSSLSNDNEKKADSDGWLQNLRTNVISQSERANAVNRRIEGLVSLLISLLNMEGYSTNENNRDIFIKSGIPLKSILETCELLVKFGLGTEHKYLSSKNKTVRDEIAENGMLLSPASIVNLTNPIRCAGYDLLHCVLTIAGSSATGPLINHGKSLAELIFFGISTTASIGVQRHFNRVSSKRQKQWLNKSIILRNKAIDSMKIGCLLFGSSCVTLPVMGKSAIMIAANLLEQINIVGTVDSDTAVDEEQWCTYGDRVALVSKAAEALSAFITVGGGYIHSTIRSTLESTISSCLSMLLPINNRGIQNSTSIIQATPVKIAILNLAKNTITIPWQDGGISTLVSKLRPVSNALRYDRDPDVIMSAFSAIAICNVIITPRSIPLSVESSREQTDSLRGLSSLSATSIFQNSKKAKKNTNDDVINGNSMQTNKTLEKMGMEVSNTVIEQKLKDDTVTTSDRKRKNVQESKSTDSVVDTTTSDGVTTEDSPTQDDHRVSKRKKENDGLDTKDTSLDVNKGECKGINSDIHVDSKGNNDVEDHNMSIEPEFNACDADNKSDKNLTQDFIKDDANKMDESPKNHEEEEESLGEESDDDSDGSLPEIVDCGPDEDDL